MKPFLLIAGDCYYPRGGADDWIDTFETKEDAEKVVLKISTFEIFQRGKNKGKEKPGTRENKIQIYGSNYDWYEIVDLRDWINR